MVTIKLCRDCQQKLDNASNALRHHAAEMEKAILLARTGSPTEEEFQDLRTRVWASFNDAEAAWDSYRQHLIEHGFLTSSHLIEHELLLK